MPKTETISAPSDDKAPNADTAEALRQSAAGEGLTSFDTFDDLVAEFG